MKDSWLEAPADGAEPRGGVPRRGVRVARTRRGAGKARWVAAAAKRMCVSGTSEGAWFGRGIERLRGLSAPARRVPGTGAGEAKTAAWGRFRGGLSATRKRRRVSTLSADRRGPAQRPPHPTTMAASLAATGALKFEFSFHRATAPNHQLSRDRGARVRLSRRRTAVAPTPRKFTVAEGSVGRVVSSAIPLAALAPAPARSSTAGPPASWTTTRTRRTREAALRGRSAHASHERPVLEGSTIGIALETAAKSPPLIKTSLSLLTNRVVSSAPKRSESPTRTRINGPHRGPRRATVGHDLRPAPE